MHTSIRILLLCSAATISSSVAAISLDISEAEDFNLVTWGNAQLVNSSAGGRVAVGENARFKSYSIGGNRNVTDPSNSAFVVGGNLSVQSGGSVGGGSIYVGGNYNGPRYDLNSEAGSRTQDRIGKENLPFNFDAIRDALTTKSTLWGREAATGSSILEYSTLTLEGSETGTNIFNIDASLLDAASSLKIFVPESAKVLINVTGAIVNFTNMGISGEFESGNTLYNFHEATKITMSGIGVEGSILAVNANVDFYSGNVNGQLIADSFQGKGWGVGSLGYSSFNNDVNVSYDSGSSPRRDGSRVSVPDTGSTLALAIIGLVIIGVLGQLKRYA